MPRAKRAPAIVEPRITVHLEDLHVRGWDVDRDGRQTHPKLRYPWPTKDALRLETERDAGNPQALRLLGEGWA
jgi:hypothetical protein